MMSESTVRTWIVCLHMMSLLSRSGEVQVAGPEPNSVQLMEQFRAVAHTVHNRTNTRMSAAGLSSARFRVLTALRSTDRMRMNELSAALGVVPRTVTTIVDAMEKDGLVVRLPDSADRRVTLLGITHEGLRQLHQLRTQHEATASELFDVLTATEKRQLVRLLRRLQAAADADSGATSPAPVKPASPLPPQRLAPAQPDA